MYAITNTKVAKYDRQSGMLIATSTGDAKHLNSGFLWQGRLYCAHSNYPLTPEQSEIKVLDVETMTLSTFKDFGNYGGSLTWAVLQDGHWWCNFARYGANNGQTFLVKFDDKWQEVARWTYPAEVVSQIGQMSFSGGLFQAGSLQVTDHDHAVLYELRVPERGTVLKFVGKHVVPFTGQGIAIDPQTGGLVGINRPKREVVFAVQKRPEAVRLRILSYNIHHCEGVDGKLDVARIAEVIRGRTRPRGTPRSGPESAAIAIHRSTSRTGSTHENARRIRPQHTTSGCAYGNAVLSRFPIRRHENIKLPRFDDGEQRGVLKLEIDLPDTDQPLLFLATHFDHRRKNEERLASVKTILGITAKQSDQPALLAGDLNDVPESAVLTEVSQQWTRANMKPQPTIPVGKPTRQIDFVLLRPQSRWRVIETKVVEETVASDHRPILATLELLAPAPKE